MALLGLPSCICSEVPMAAPACWTRKNSTNALVMIGNKFRVEETGRMGVVLRCIRLGLGLWRHLGMGWYLIFLHPFLQGFYREILFFARFHGGAAVLGFYS